MAKRSRNVRYFARAADLRLGDAEFLRVGGRVQGAVYLAGYAVECLLKALILSLHSEHEQPQVIREFRGSFGHDFQGLREMYRKAGGANLPSAVVEAFIIVSSWETSLRYESRIDLFGDVDEFFAAIDVFVEWAKERL